MELEATGPRRAMFKFEFQEDTANNENKSEREKRLEAAGLAKVRD